MVRIVTLLVLLGTAFSLPAAEPNSWENEAYRMDLADDGAVVITCKAGGKPVTFRPRFVVWHQPEPMSLVSVKWDKPIYNLLGWKFADGRIERDLYRAGETTVLEFPEVEADEDSIEWDFQDELLYISAFVSLDKGTDAPTISYLFSPRTNVGSWSVAYAGAPEAELKNVRELWQPLIWDGRRLPEEAFLTPDDQCSIPGCLVETNDGTVGVMLESRLYPYAMPSALVRQFGVTVRNETGKAQPLVFAPLPGSADSLLQSGGWYDRLFLISRPEPLSKTFEYVARNVCGFRDVRENTVATLNQALDRMLAFAQGPWGNFDAANKAYAYPDSPGSVKNVSALHPLGLAIATDDEKLFRDQGVPILEFLLSREKFLFALDEASLASSQTPSRKIAGPAMPVSELAALDRLAHGATPYFRSEAERLSKLDRALNMTWVSRGDAWQNDLWRYRITRDPADLARAVDGANHYIAERVDREPTDFAEAKDGTFFEYMVPVWRDLYELYCDTKDLRHLAAAHRGARRYAQFIWFYPSIPDGDVTVNETGLAPRRGSLTTPGLIKVAPATVPAWRVSEHGTMCEGNGTVQRLALFLATHAPWFMRIGQDADDEFLKAIARSAVVGRYANFPGYHFNTKYSTVHELADFPERPFDELKPTTSMHYNHILPTANLVLDFLMAEAYDRSKKAIDFPAEFVESYAFLQGRIYGATAGKFYDATDARLWMPAGLVQTDERQVNYVAARAPGKFCVALMNEAEQPLENVTIRLNPNRFTTPLAGKIKAVVWRDNVRQAEPLDVVDGAATVSLSPRGLTALLIDGLDAKVAFQNALFSQSRPTTTSRSVRFAAPIGEMQATVISFGPKLTWLYAYATADDKQAKSATLHVVKPSGDVTVTDGKFPFEFSVPLDATDGELQLSIELTTPGDAQSQRSESVTLR